MDMQQEKLKSKETLRGSLVKSESSFGCSALPERSDVAAGTQALSFVEIRGTPDEEIENTLCTPSKCKLLLKFKLP